MAYLNMFLLLYLKLIKFILKMPIFISYINKLNVLFTVIKKMKFLENIFSNYFLKKAWKIKKATFIMVTFNELLKCINSPGGIRTCDQSINSRSLYR